MKLIKYIFLIYILFTAVIPCSVYSSCSKENVVLYSTNSIINSDDCTEDCESSCSPFIQCGTCHNFTCTTKDVFNTPKINSSNNVVLDLSSYLENPSGSIWQPPKLS